MKKYCVKLGVTVILKTLAFLGDASERYQIDRHDRSSALGIAQTGSLSLKLVLLLAWQVLWLSTLSSRIAFSDHDKTIY